MKRPPVILRVAILVAAIACLALAMYSCGRSKQPPQQPTTNTQQPPPEGSADQKANPPPQTPPAPEPKVDHFPATKAPGRLYQ